MNPIHYLWCLMFRVLVLSVWYLIFAVIPASVRIAVAILYVGHLLTSDEEKYKQKKYRRYYR